MTPDVAVFPFLLAVAVILPICLSWIRYRRKANEERLRLIRELAAEGKLSREQLDRLLCPPSRLMSLVMVLAWFALFGGIATLIVNFFLVRRPDDDAAIAGVLMIVFALAALSAPIMLRELRSQELT